MEKNGLEISWIATFPQNLALICLTVSEKTRFTDRRTKDGHLRHSIDCVTRAKNLDPSNQSCRLLRQLILSWHKSFKVVFIAKCSI